MRRPWALEDHLNASYTLKVDDWLKASVQTGPQFRHQDFYTGDDFSGEMFDRRDLSAVLRFQTLTLFALATRGQAPYADHSHGYWNDAGYALLMDLTFFEHLNLLAGGRFDNFYVQTSSYGDVDGYDEKPWARAVDSENHSSWSASLSYGLPFGVRPYATAARQSTLTTGEGGRLIRLSSSPQAVAPSRRQLSRNTA